MDVIYIVIIIVVVIKLTILFSWQNPASSRILKCAFIGQFKQTEWAVKECAEEYKGEAVVDLGGIQGCK